MKDEKDNSEKTSSAKTGFPKETELKNQSEGGDANYTEQNDVTGPEKREFPSVGNATTDFVSRPTARKTGRMVGHEPGTEGI